MSATSRGLQIFVVENDRDTLAFLSMYLEAIGHQVESASTMGAALTALPRSKCDILISDIGLPDGDGWQLMQKATFAKPVYAIAISGYGTKADVQRSKDAGFRQHLLKPFGGSDLARSIEEAAREIELNNEYSKGNEADVVRAPT